MDVLTLIKHSLVTDNSNPITKYFQLGRQTASGGPEMVWKVYEATRIRDKAVWSIYNDDVEYLLFDEAIDCCVECRAQVEAITRKT